ncbi:hypothetical protein [Hymenobacter sp. UYP22]|uniref:hypothetical protein n=1 Tax=Hymenobacter sp. UYP22 TaxID=3156348 RepID=UPI003390F529
MNLALELEFPDDQAANVLRLLQSVPDVTARILTHPATRPYVASATAPKSEAELEQLFQRLAGAWQSEESGEELARQLQQDRQDTPRGIAL